MRVSADRLRWHRLRRSGLVEPFASVEETARRLVGVQAQMPAAAAVALWNRTRGCTRAALERARLERRTLVRFWGQRNTVHLYASEDWPWLHAALRERQSLLRGRLAKAGVLEEFRRLARRAAKRLAAGETLTYEDVRSKALEEKQDTWSVAYVVFMELVRDGVACHGEDRGARSTFVHRERWLPELDWSPPEEEEAGAQLARRYLAAYGPAQARDLAFWYGTTVAAAGRWLAALDALGETVAVVVDGAEHTALVQDAEALSGERPPPRGRWPVHLLHRFDPLLLGTKDKSWLVDDAHYKRVWRSAGHVDAVVLVGGRIAGTWRYDRRSKGLAVRVEPFAPLAKTVERAVRRRAEELADFLEAPRVEVELARPGRG